MTWGLPGKLAHQVLCDEKKILHRDISHNNIMLYQPHQGLSSGAERRGFLSDYDYAARLVPIDEVDVQLGVDSAQRQLTVCDCYVDFINVQN